VITLRLVVAETGGTRETVVISPTESDGNVIGSVEGRAALVSSIAAKPPVGSGWYEGSSRYKTSNSATFTAAEVLASSLNPPKRLAGSFEVDAYRGRIPARVFC